MTFSFQNWGVLDMMGSIVNPNEEKLMKKVIRTYKTSELYTKLYGRTACEHVAVDPAVRGTLGKVLAAA